MKTTDHKETLVNHMTGVSLSINASHLSIDQQVSQAFHESEGQSTDPTAPGSSLPGTSQVTLGFASSSLGVHDPAPAAGDPSHGSGFSASTDLSIPGIDTALAGLEAKFADIGQTDPIRAVVCTPTSPRHRFQGKPSPICWLRMV